MNYIWSGMIITAIICAVFKGTLDETVTAAFDGANAAVQIIISLSGIMCFWTGLLKIAECSGISRTVQRLLSPIVKIVFKNAPKKAREYITMNMTANMLGMGNAATPMGIKAMAELETVNKRKETASRDMCMLVALNTASIQLIPATIMAVRQSAGSSEPAAIAVPVLAASFAGCIAAVTAVNLFIKD